MHWIKKWRVNRGLKCMWKLNADGIKLTLTNKTNDGPTQERFLEVARTLAHRLDGRKCYVIVETNFDCVVLVFVRKDRSGDGKPWWRKRILEC